MISHKFSALLISPLCLIIFLILISIIFRSIKTNIITILILITLSSPVISKKLIIYLERNYKPIKISNIQYADAIVVLSGMVKQIKGDNFIKYEFNEKVDRIIAGINLIKNNKAPVIILTRGKTQYSIGKPEAEFLKDFALDYGILENKIILSEVVYNTNQEVLAVKKILHGKNKKIILVTSAFHMKRAQDLFEKNDFYVVPFPVDFMNTGIEANILDFIPSADAFLNTSIFVQEMVGRLYYDFKYR